MAVNDDLGQQADDGRSTIAEIDLMDAVRDIWGARRTLIVTAVLAIIVGLVFLFAGRKEFSATAVLGPAESSSQQGGLGSALGQLSGAASLLGVRVGSTGPNDFVKFRELLTSERLANALFQNYALRPVFFASVWSAETRNWQRPSGLAFKIKQIIKYAIGGTRWSPPQPITLRDYLKSNLSVLTDKVTGYTTLSIQEDTPEHAVQVLRAIIIANDSLIRQDVKDRTAGRIVYLHKVLQQTSLQDQREAIISVLSAQEKTMMMTSADKTYAVDAIDPPWADPAQSSPTFGSTVVKYLLLTVLVIIFWAVIRGYFYVRLGRNADVTNADLDTAISDWLERHLGGITNRLSRQHTHSAHSVDTSSEQ